MSTLTGTGVVVRIDNGVPLRGSLTVETDRIDVSTWTPPRLPDPSWTFVDHAGHFHAFDDAGKLPTLREKRVEHTNRFRRLIRHPGKTIRYDWGSHRRYSHLLVCDVCGEQVTPNWRAGSCHQSMPGLSTYTLRVEDVLARSVEFGKRYSVVVTAGTNQYFGFAHFTSSHRWEPGDLGEAPWAEFICSPLARRKIRPVDALPSDGPPAP